MKLLMSKHALEQARERGVSINEIKEAVQKGAKSPQDGKTITIYGHLKVIFKKINETVFVITVMIRKLENGK